MRFGLLAVSVLLLNIASAPKPEVYKPGQFSGVLRLQPLGDGVHMIVLNNYAYVDGYKRTLDAAPGFSTDGASIPRALWTLVGSPFTGKYIGAAVIHDVGCVSHKYTWQETHRMFYEAMLDSGVDQNYAKILYYGVRVGGPKWQKKTIQASELDHVRNEVEAHGGRLEIEHDPTSSASHSKLNDYPIQTLFLYPQRSITEMDLQAFQRELKKRAMEGHPISAEEIERRTDTSNLPEGNQ